MMMLPNINLLYLGATMERFWTQFEAWCSMHRRTLVKFVSNERERDRHVTAQKAYETLSSPDVTVTNAKDKEMQLPKILKLDENVKEAMIDGAKFVSRATIDLDHD